MYKWQDLYKCKEQYSIQPIKLKPTNKIKDQKRTKKY